MPEADATLYAAVLGERFAELAPTLQRFDACRRTMPWMSRARSLLCLPIVVALQGACQGAPGPTEAAPAGTPQAEDSAQAANQEPPRSSALAEPALAEPVYDGPPKTVLVELFSSQGCNSCPAADALIGRFAELGLTRERVIPLTFHVTYWDDLGWADPFASAIHDQRQIAYAQILPQARADDETTIRGPYTPQMVVDGRVHFSGSLAEVAAQEIERATRRPTAIDMSATASWSSAAEAGSTIAVEITSKAEPDAGLDTDRTKIGLFAALAQTRAQTEVPRGENAGKTLVEHELVRAFAGPKLFRSGRELNHTQLELTVEAGLSPSEASVVVFAQDLGSLEILAVTEARIEAQLRG